MVQPYAFKLPICVDIVGRLIKKLLQLNNQFRNAWVGSKSNLHYLLVPQRNDFIGRIHFPDIGQSNTKFDYWMMWELDLRSLITWINLRLVYRDSVRLKRSYLYETKLSAVWKPFGNYIWLQWSRSAVLLIKSQRHFVWPSRWHGSLWPSRCLSLLIHQILWYQFNKLLRFNFHP